MKLSQHCNRIIEYSFYTLFFLVPLIFWGSTSELFELNKMWLTYGLTIIIIGCWITDMVIKKSFFVKKTPLDIPLILFLFSQIISTIFSLDSHVSFFGYYSRFNGGLLSTTSYILLYYAFVTYFDINKTKKIIQVILISGLFVVLWGIPSHFGYDPTCFVFRRELNVSCWTEAFKPTIRIFSTLGQPAWLAAYLATLIPLTIAFTLQKTQNTQKASNPDKSDSLKLKNTDILTHRVFRVFWKYIFFILLTLLFYISLLYTGTRAGFLGFWIANFIFWLIIFLKRIFSVKTFLVLFLILNSQLSILNFFIGTPVDKLNRFTFNSIKQNLSPKTSQNTIKPTPTDTSITNSADIRRIVWKGAIDAWLAYPIFGSGVETFAFAYYRYRPVEHNLTSEWDYLYNKAHNEYLNYLTTTGIFGLGSYLLIIGIFIVLIIKILNSKSETRSADWRTIFDIRILTIGLFTGWLSILVTNFFGFSVVIMNLFLFLIPAFIFVLNDKLTPRFNTKKQSDSPALKLSSSQTRTTVSQWLGITFLLLITCYLLLILFRHWQADRSYSLGFNLSRANYPQEAFTALTDAVSIRPSEPVFQDELSMTTLQMSLLLFQQNEATAASEFAQSAIDLNTHILSNHPNYLPFWKSRVRMFYTLGELVPDYKKEALIAAKQASILAPTDAKIWYNLGVLFGQTGQDSEGIKILNKTIEMKPDYQDAYHAVGLLYRQKATDDAGVTTDPEMQLKAVEAMEKLLKINPDYKEAKQSLKEWNDANKQ